MAADRTSCPLDEASPADECEDHADEVTRRQLEYARSRLEHAGDLSAEQDAVVAELADAIGRHVAPMAAAVQTARAANERPDPASDRR